MNGFSTTPPKGAGEEFRFIKTSSLNGGEIEPAAVRYGADGLPESIALIGRGGSCKPTWVSEWGPLVSAEGNNFIGSLHEAQQKVLAGRSGKKGVHCECCGRPASLFKRALNKDMARFLCLLAVRTRAAGKFVWIDVQKIDVRGGDYAKLRYWGLIEQKPNEDSAKRTSGFWRLTQKGLDFVDLKIGVPSHALVVSGGMLVGFVDSTVYINDVPNFNYAELMRG